MDRVLDLQPEQAGRLGAAAFAGMGLLALTAPSAIPRLMGMRITGDAGRNEVRAVYGGFGLAVAASLLTGEADHRATARRHAGLSLLGMASGRAADLVISGRPSLAGAVAMTGETALGALLIRG